MKTNNSKLSAIAFLAVASAVLLGACEKEDEDGPARQLDASYNPVMAAADFTNSTRLTNAYFPFQAGKKFIYEGQTQDGLERVEVRHLPETRTVLGIPCVVVNDKVWLNGRVREDTDDWYAQQNNGTVWYMGEYVTDFNPDGSVKDHAGAWEAGVDGAKPGIQMQAQPRVGTVYRQEYYFNVAEDAAEIVETGVTVAVPFGTFSNCIKIKEYSDIIPDAVAYKYYAPGIGMVKEVNVEDNEEVVLIGIE